MEIRINEDMGLANVKTGEFYELEKGSKIISPERQEQKKKYAAHKSETFESKNFRYSQTMAVRGNFFAVLCDETELLWDQISNPTISKLIYLSTYIDSNNCICFDGNWHKNNDNGSTVIYRKPVPMKKEDIQNIMNVNRKTFSKFWNECIELNIITEKDGAFYLPKDMVRFCNNSGINKQKTRMIKVFKHAIRYMYQNTDERSKKTLSHLYRLIPFINLKYNVLCENPFEERVDMIKPLNAADICEMLGLERHMHKRVVNALKKLSFIDKNGDLRSVISYRWDMKNNEDRYWININPQFYSGYIKENEMISLVDEFMLNDDTSSTIQNE